MRIMALAVIATVAGANPGFAQFRQQTAEKTGFGFTADILFAQVGGVRKGTVEVTWPVAARGKLQ